ncbi:MAG: hypothetical protein Q9218_006016 [Villophora microphyllina]
MAAGIADKKPDQSKQPYNDWPNDAGFETFHEEKTPIELKVTGKIPAYAAGSTASLKLTAFSSFLPVPGIPSRRSSTVHDTNATK